MTDGALDTDGFMGRYNELEAEAAQRAEAAAALPEDPSGYEVALPENLDLSGFDLPEGFAPQLDQGEDMAPIWGEFQSFMHQHQLPKEAMGTMLGMLAKYQATQVARDHASAVADFQSLGDSAQSRVQNIARKIQSALPKDQADALMAATGTALGVQALEKLLSPRTPKSPAPLPGGVDRENMKPYERLQYANSQSA